MVTQRPYTLRNILSSALLLNLRKAFGGDVDLQNFHRFNKQEAFNIYRLKNKSVFIIPGFCIVLSGVF